MSGYDAFQANGTAAAAAAAVSSSTVVPPPLSSSLTSSLHALHLFDETAASWLMRDVSQSHLIPDSMRHYLQGSRKMWNMIKCFEGEEDTEEEEEATMTGAAASHRPRRPPNFEDPTLHAGDMLELYGTHGSGKTEMLYQCVLNCIMPKHVFIPDLDSSIFLHGCDDAAVVIDFDYRFHMTRVEELLRLRIEKEIVRARRNAQKAQNKRQKLSRDPGFPPSVDDDASYRDATTSLIASYFSSASYSRLQHHCLSHVFIIYAQTPRQSLIALNEIDALVQEFGNRSEKVNPSWKKKEEKEKTERMKTRQQQQQQQHRQAASDMDAEMKTPIDLSDPHNNPSISAADAAAAVAASTPSTSSSSSPTPRISLLCIDNISAFHWQVSRQSIGHAGIGGGLYTRERAEVGAAAFNLTASGAAGGGAEHTRASDATSTWFYELFSQQMRYILNTYQIIGVATKTPAYHKQVRGSAEDLQQRALQDRISARGQLRGAALKTIKSAKVKQTETTNQEATMKFQFRLSSEGIKAV